MFIKKLLTVCLIGFTVVCHGEIVQNDAMSEVATKTPSPMDSKASAQSQGESLTRANQLRCWQWGKLIFAENDVHLTESSRARFAKLGNRKIHLYDYGEALCVYLEE